LIKFDAEISLVDNKNIEKVLHTHIILLLDSPGFWEYTLKQI